eukprot:3162638-Amphidinium_carterae.1
MDMHTIICTMKARKLYVPIASHITFAPNGERITTTGSQQIELHRDMSGKTEASVACRFCSTAGFVLNVAFDHLFEGFWYAARQLRSN